jgi:hypothetical protein
MHDIAFSISADAESVVDQVTTGLSLQVDAEMRKQLMQKVKDYQSLKWDPELTLEYSAMSPLQLQYADLLKRTLTSTTYPEREQNIERVKEGREYAQNAHTVIGWRRLENIQLAIEYILKSGVEGDFLEAGVWKGGACIFATGVLQALGDAHRRVWVVDSFEGLPRPTIHGVRNTTNNEVGWSEQRDFYAISVDQVRQNFEAYGLLSERVRFVKGFFAESLREKAAELGMNKLAILRMDGDMYESYMDVLFNLYERVSVGGVVIVDDYRYVELHVEMELHVELELYVVLHVELCWAVCLLTSLLMPLAHLVWTTHALQSTISAHGTASWSRW